DGRDESWHTPVTAKPLRRLNTQWRLQFQRADAAPSIASRGRQARRLAVGPLGEETVRRLLDQHLGGRFALADPSRGVDREQERFVAAPIRPEQLIAEFDLPLAAALHDEVLGWAQAVLPWLVQSAERLRRLHRLSARGAGGLHRVVQTIRCRPAPELNQAFARSHATEKDDRPDIGVGGLPGRPPPCPKRRART